MSDQKIEIEFLTKQSGDGAQKTAQEITQVKQAAESATPVQQKLNEATAETTKSTEKAVSAKKGLVQGLRGLATEVPIVGRAVHLLTSAYAALGVTLAFVISKVMEKLRALSESEAHLHRVNQAMADVDQTAGKLSITWAVAKQEAKEFADEMVKLTSAGKTTVEMMAQLNEQLAERQRLTAEIEDPEKAAEIAAIEARTDLTPEQKSIEKAKVEKRAEEARKIRERNDQLLLVKGHRTAAQTEAEAVGNAKYELPGAVEEMVAAQNEARKAGVFAKGNAADFEKRAPEVLERQRKSQNRIAELEQVVKNALPDGRGGGPRSFAIYALEEEKKNLAKIDEEYEQLVQGQARAEINAENANFKAADAKDRVTSIRATIRESTKRGLMHNEAAEEITGRVLRGASADPRMSRSRSPLLGAGDDGGDGIARTAVGMNTRINKTMRAIGGGGEDGSAASGQIQQAAGQLLKGSSELATAITTLAQSVASFDAPELKKQIEKLARQLETVKSQVEHSRL